MTTTWQWTWATVAFASELAALAALGAWGFSASASPLPRLLLGLGTPLAAAVLWGVFAAPHAPLQGALLTPATKLVVYGAAVLALAGTGSPRLAAALAAAGLLGSLWGGLPAPGVTTPAAGVTAPAAS